MAVLEPDLHVMDDDGGPDEQDDDVRGGGGDLESLRDALVDAFNARDLDGVVGLAADDVELPDLHGDGVDDLEREIIDLWDRRPGLLLTRAHTEEGEPVAAVWIRNEERGWSCVALMCLSEEDGELTVLEIIDDVATMDSVSAEPPDDADVEEGGEFEQWTDGSDG